MMVCTTVKVKIQVNVKGVSLSHFVG